MSEAEILQSVIFAVGSRPDCRCWRNTVGLFKQGPRVVRVGIPGQSDVFGVRDDGRFISIEVKKPGGVVSAEQRSWIAMVQKFGGIAGVVYSADEAMKLIDSVPRQTTTQET